MPGRQKRKLESVAMVILLSVNVLYVLRVGDAAGLDSVKESSCLARDGGEVVSR